MFFGGWGKPGCGGRIMLETGESGYFDTISMGFFFVLFSLYCFTDIHEIWNEFLIKNKMEKKQACKFSPRCFMGKNAPVIWIEFSRGP